MRGARSTPVLVTEGQAVVVLADQAKLHTAIEHLVQNAVEASRPDRSGRLGRRIATKARR